MINTSSISTKSEVCRDIATMAALLIILIVATVVRLHYADEFGTYDELWHLALTTGHGTPFGQYGTDVIDFHPRSQTSLADKLPAWKVWTTLGPVLHPPTYLLTLRLWREAFGESDTIARAYSIFWSLVAIAFTFLISRAAMSRTIGLMAAMTMALAPTQVYLGQEIRSYAMLVAVGCVAIWLMTRIELLGSTRRRAFALGTTPFCLLIVHYFAIFPVIAIAAYGMRRLNSHRRTFIITSAMSAAIYAVCWMPIALGQVKALSTGDDFLRVRERDWTREIQFLVAGPIRQLFDRPLDKDHMLLLTGLAFVIPWFVARRLSPLWPWTLWLCCSIFGLFILDVARHSEHLAYVRYTTLASPAALPVLIGMFWATRRWAGYAVAGTLLVASAVYLNANVGVVADSPGFGQVARAVSKRVMPGDAVITYRGRAFKHAGEFIQLHLSHEPGLFPRPIIDLSEPMTREVQDQLPRRSWLITVAYFGPIDAIVPGARVVATHSVDDGINLYELALPPLDAPTTSPATADR